MASPDMASVTYQALLRGGGEQLQQLCIIIADGRFHEKEALRRQMRDMGARRGLLVAFIVLVGPCHPPHRIPRDRRVIH
jgi:hypothetical protein